MALFQPACYMGDLDQLIVGRGIKYANKFCCRLSRCGKHEKLRSLLVQNLFQGVLKLFWKRKRNERLGRFAAGFAKNLDVKIILGQFSLIHGALLTRLQKLETPFLQRIWKSDTSVFASFLGVSILFRNASSARKNGPQFFTPDLLPLIQNQDTRHPSPTIAAESHSASSQRQISQIYQSNSRILKSFNQPSAQICLP